MNFEKLPKDLQIKLMKYGFKQLDRKINKPYFHQSSPKDTRLWHRIMEAQEDE